MRSYIEQRFTGQVEEAISQLRYVLHSSKRPALPRDVPHAYCDKYALAESTINTSIVATVTVLEALGLDEPKLRALIERHADGQHLELRLRTTETCAFLKEVRRSVFGPSVVSKTLGVSTETKTKTDVKEYFWRFTSTWAVLVVPANDDQSAVVLDERVGSCVLCSGSMSPPHRESAAETIGCDVTWLVAQLAPTSLGVRFAIDRASDRCRTPRRNAEVDAALSAYQELHSWCARVEAHFNRHLVEEQNMKPPSARGDGLRGWCCVAVNAKGDEDPQTRPPLPEAAKRLLAVGEGGVASRKLFVPVQPLFEEAPPVAMGARLAIDPAELSVHLAPASATPDLLGAEPDAARTLARTTDGAAAGGGSSSAAPAAAFDAPLGASLAKASMALSEATTEATAAEAGPLLTPADVGLMLGRQRQTLRSHTAELGAAFPPPTEEATLFSAKEATAVVMTSYLQRLLQQTADCVAYIEQLLRHQLVAAIGKQVSSVDLARYLEVRAADRAPHAPL